MGFVLVKLGQLILLLLGIAVGAFLVFVIESLIEAKITEVRSRRAYNKAIKKATKSLQKRIEESLMDDEI